MTVCAFPCVGAATLNSRIGRSVMLSVSGRLMVNGASQDKKLQVAKRTFSMQPFSKNYLRLSA